ncbi:DNA-binding MarR family transcriptional regulator [Pullulanibacillus pueri]|uniref:Transcriptional regulator n=1 Tax=Pullulanibacillus pueri TaxID=1437324 RepID=A0A8J2ZV63_9BACL|nr:MarR family transcriptional regulator [Pullulanibacillus pueri]MBM7681605.1 DNA-binding MarR family transcriptional regulator [Pullulanibacillus pueri]GGH79486.1 transcriptional regulator [Pullulanibacillus pueri]
MVDYDEAIGFNTVKTGKHITRLLNSRLKPYNLTAEQWTVLKRLDQQGDSSQKRLAEASDKDQATLTKILDLLESHAFIERVKNPNDRRSFLVCLTPKGRELTKSIYTVIEEIFEQIVAGLSTEELSNYQDVLRKIIHNIQDIKD